MPQPAAIMVDPKTLTPWRKNPRKNDAAVAKVADSIKRFGWGAVILARRLPDGSAEIIAGHTRLKAAISLKLPEVPVRWMDHLSDAEAHALALADNKLGEIAEWDAAGLAETLREIEAGGADVAGLGWDEATLAELLGDLSAAGDGIADALGGLPSGDRAPIQSMTFTLHDDQAATVREAIEASKDLGPFVDTGNENSNGNALARVCEMWLGGQR